MCDDIMPAVALGPAPLCQASLVLACCQCKATVSSEGFPFPAFSVAQLQATT